MGVNYTAIWQPNPLVYFQHGHSIARQHLDSGAAEIE